jgi:hypothetical protein
VTSATSKLLISADGFSLWRMHVGLLKQRKVSLISFINQHRPSHCHQSHVSSVRRSRFSTSESGCSPALQQHSRFEAAQKEVEGDKVGNYALDEGRPKEAWCQFVTVRGVPCVKFYVTPYRSAQRSMDANPCHSRFDMEYVLHSNTHCEYGQWGITKLDLMSKR